MQKKIKKILKTYLGQITSGNPKHKEKYQFDTIKSVKKFHDSRQKIIDLFNDSTKIRSESIYRSKQDKTARTGLKIPTPKQMLQILPIDFAQVKVGNNSKSLLNEIRQTVYSLYQSKQITKKVFNNIIKSIQ